MSRNFLSTQDELRVGDFLMSNNEIHKAVFQEDGNFVIYSQKPTWASDTWNAQGAHRIIMQEDGNLVMYTKADRPIWATNTGAGTDQRNRLFLRNDGVLQIDRNGVEIWNSTRCKGNKESNETNVTEG